MATVKFITLSALDEHTKGGRRVSANESIDIEKAEPEKPRAHLRVRAPRGEPCIVITRTVVSCNGYRPTNSELKALRSIASKILLSGV